MSPRWKPKRELIPSEVEGETLVPLTNGLHAIIDSVNAEWVGMHNWCSVKGKGTHYAIRRVSAGGDPFFVPLHRAVWEHSYGTIPAGNQIHHRNGNGLYNRIGNLMSVTPSLNNAYRASSRPAKMFGFPKGVFRYGNRKRFVAMISVNGTNTYIGSFDDAEAASEAFQARWQEIYGPEIMEIEQLTGVN